MPAADRNGSLGVIGKATSLLDQLAANGELSAAGLSESAWRAATTVYRLIRALEQAEFVEPADRAGSYRLGLKLFRLGGAVVARFDERQAALPHMEALHATTGETVFLCIRRGTRGGLHRADRGSRAVSLALTLGGVLPLHAGAAPRVLLAEQPRTAWQEYYEAARQAPHARPSAAGPRGVTCSTSWRPSAARGSRSRTRTSRSASRRSARRFGTTAARSRQRSRSAACARPSSAASRARMIGWWSTPPRPSPRRSGFQPAPAGSRA